MAMSEINSMPPKVMGEKLAKLLNLLMDYPKLLDMNPAPPNLRKSQVRNM
jgi:hypothetical protein